MAKRADSGGPHHGIHGRPKPDSGRQDRSDPEKRGIREGHPRGFDGQLSGEATVGRDMINAAKDSAKATGGSLSSGTDSAWCHLPLPALAFIPLVTVVVAVQLSMSLLILLASHQWVILFQD